MVLPYICCLPAVPVLSPDGLSHAGIGLQVPKYQHITAVLYDEDYGGDDEVSHHFLHLSVFATVAAAVLMVYWKRITVGSSCTC